MRKVCVPTILTRYHDDLAIGAVSEGCTLSSLEAKVQPIQVSPCQAGLAGQRLSVSTRFLLSQHALVPFGFRRQVGWVTQKSSLPNFSFLQKGSINGLSGAHHRRNDRTGVVDSQDRQEPARAASALVFSPLVPLLAVLFWTDKWLGA